MERDIVKHLNRYYYGMLLLAIVAASASYFLIVKGLVSPVDPMSTLGTIFQSLVILDALITIPLGLYGFKHRCLKLQKEEDELLRFKLYEKAAIARIILVSNAMVLALIACYIMGGYRSMMWVAAISAIAWYFAKPTEKKIFLEMNTPEDEQY